MSSNRRTYSNRRSHSERDPVSASERPYDDPPGRLERAWFCSQFDHPHQWHRQRVPRRSRRILNQLSAINPDDFGQYCENCSRGLAPNITGRCPSCWRTRGTLRPGTSSYLCVCRCTCGPEHDDADDMDYVPPVEELRDHDGDVGDAASDPGSPPSVPAPAELLATGQVCSPNPTVRDYYSEHPDHYDLARNHTDGDPQGSSFLNITNMTARPEFISLFRMVDRSELAGFLRAGYTRDQLRAQFVETRSLLSRNYLPPDSIDGSRIIPEEHFRCMICNRLYDDDLLEAFQAAQSLHRFGKRLVREVCEGLMTAEDALEDFMDERAEVVAIQFCDICCQPMRAGVLPLTLNHYYCCCDCRCDVHLPPPSPSSEPSTESLPLVRTLIDETVMADDDADEDPGQHMDDMHVITSRSDRTRRRNNSPDSTW